MLARLLLHVYLRNLAVEGFFCEYLRDTSESLWRDFDPYHFFSAQEEVLLVRLAAC